MSYNFGQFRKNQQDTYLKNLLYTFNNLITHSDISENVFFEDKQLSFPGEILQSSNKAGIYLKSYYLRFRVYRQAEKQEINIQLYNSSLQTDNKQKIETITIEPGAETEYDTFEFIIQPNMSYNSINFILNRLATDYLKPNPNGSYGRTLKISIEKIAEILNIIESLSTAIDNKTVLKQIGIQSKPGLLMSINGEGIKVGRSGIYEINNGITVNSIGFVLEPEDNTYFIMDYQY